MKNTKAFFVIGAALLAAFLCPANAAVVRTTLSTAPAAWPGPLTLGADGSLYGTLNNAGPNDCYIFGCGQVYRLKPPAAGGTSWTREVLRNFDTDENGDWPSGAVALAPDGSVFGTNDQRDASNQFGKPGVVYQLTPQAGLPWSETVVHAYPGNSGSEELTGLISDGHGGFYGADSWNGDFEAGTIFSLTPASAGGWNFQTIFDFAHGSGQNPLANVVMDKNGALYGVLTVSYDIFQLTPPAAGQSGWSETILHHFPKAELRASLFVDGKGVVYGTTANKIFRLTPPKPKPKGKPPGKWAMATLASFPKKMTPVMGAGLSGVVVDSAGVVYGLTGSGGGGPACGTAGCGTLFKLTPIPGGNKYSFAVLDQAGGGGLIAGPDGTLYGVTGTTVFSVTGSGFQP